MKRTWFAVLLMFVCATPAAAQDPADPDQEGCKDSKLLSRMPGCQLFDCSTKEYDAVEIIVGADKASGEVARKALEGAIDFQHYVCPAKYSQLQLARNLETALKKAGYTFVVPVSKNESGEYMLTVRKGEQWLGVEFSNFNEYPQYRQTAVLVKDMEQEVVADASALAAEIEKSGSVAVYGITFDTGKATINPQSETVLNEIVTLMKDNGEWRFEVQGHTDNVGAAAANATLSQQRAAAVVSWLTKNGVEASRLVAKGYGDTAPVADNTSDEGRAKNRRVELKKIN